MLRLDDAAGHFPRKSNRCNYRIRPLFADCAHARKRAVPAVAPQQSNQRDNCEISQENGERWSTAFSVCGMRGGWNRWLRYGRALSRAFGEQIPQAYRCHRVSS